jgi:serine/threonine protein kinase
MLSSGSGGGGVLGTDCSTGSLSGGSVFQDALMRYQTEELVKEIAILKKLHHPNIVNLVEVIDDPSTDSLLLAMEYVEGGTLQPGQVSPGHWESLPEREVWRYVREVLQVGEVVLIQRLGPLTVYSHGAHLQWAGTMHERLHTSVGAGVVHVHGPCAEG